MHYARFKGEAQRDRTAFGREKKAGSIYGACFGNKAYRDRITS